MMTQVAFPGASARNRHDLPLGGCTPEPLMAYLKALGLLRIVAEQVDPAARGAWQRDTFRLHSALDLDELVRFFLDSYMPTPVVAPWNGSSGFFAKDNKDALMAILASESDRLVEYRRAIQLVQSPLGGALREKPEDQEKAHFRRRFRSILADETVRWMDAAFMETDDQQAFAPLLGTGGNDGHLEFSQNFMQRICDVILVADRDVVEQRLRLALFGEGNGALASASVGQFDPGGVGGPNAIPGFKAGSLVNPWDFVLMIEGAILLTGSAARRLGVVGGLRASFPFMVRPSGAGWGTIAGPDARKRKASKREPYEIWLPLWERPASVQELGYIFAEGRAQIGRRMAQNGVDFARAIAGLGVDRGLTAFHRYGFLERSGKAFIAAPLGRLPVEHREAVHLLDEIDPWLSRFRRFASGDRTPARYQRSLRAIEDAIFAYCQFGGARHLQDVLVALGVAERELGLSPKVHEDVGPLPDKSLPPGPLDHLSPRWLQACDDGSAEFRIAAALASIDGSSGPIRKQLEPVEWQKRRWSWASSDLGVVWGGGNLTRNLAAILDRRQLQAEQRRRDGGDVAVSAGPNPALRARFAVTLADVHRFLVGDVDDRRIAELFWALATLRWRDFRPDLAPGRGPLPAPDLPRAYALLKLLYLDAPIRAAGPEAVAIRPEPAILNRLAAGDLAGATTLAHRRLRSSGLVVRGSTGVAGRSAPAFVCEPLVQARLAAALLIPIWQVDTLADLVLTPGPAQQIGTERN